MNRSYLYQDVLKLYSDDETDIEFVDEMAVDMGGVSRDMIAGFCMGACIQGIL